MSYQNVMPHWVDRWELVPMRMDGVFHVFGNQIDQGRSGWIAPNCRLLDSLSHARTYDARVEHDDVFLDGTFRGSFRAKKSDVCSSTEDGCCSALRETQAVTETRSDVYTRSRWPLMSAISIG